MTCRTIVISDVHLGSKWSRAKEATRFLKEHSCKTLILCGDIIDGWELMRGKKAKWRRRHTNFMKTLLDISSKTDIFYIRGNHDDFLDRVLPMRFANMAIVRDMIYESGGKRYFVLHGDVLDRVTLRMKWVSKLGSIGYAALLGLNKLWPRYSFAKAIKKRVKASVSRVSNFEQNISDLARAHECGGVICGHIHQPEIRNIDGVLYLNSGDWVESLSALVEDFDGNWEIVRVEKSLEEA